MSVYFSVIIPVYNSKLYISKCVESVLNQTFRDFELICVDDGSTDGSGSVLDRYAAKDDRMRVIHIENGGIANARNTGLECARGIYVCFIDSDDWVDEDLLEKVYRRYSDARTEIIILDYFLERGDKTEYVRSNKYLREGKVEDIKSYESLSAYFFGGCRVVWTKFVLRRLLEESHIRFKELFHVEDVLYCLEIYSRAEKIEYGHLAGYHYLDNSASISRRYIGEKIVEMYVGLYEQEKKIESNFEGVDFQKIINTYLINTLMSIAQRFVFHPSNKMGGRQRKEYMADLLERYPFSQALKNYDRQYLSRGAKLFIVTGRPRLFWLEAGCFVKRLRT